LTYTASGSYTA